MKITSIENCLNVIPNKFELSLLVANRAKSILAGSPTTLDYNVSDDKASYIALKEIEENKLDISTAKKELKEELLRDNLFLKNTSKKDFKSDLSADDSDDNFDLDELMDSMEFDEDMDSEDSIDEDIDINSEIE